MAAIDASKLKAKAMYDYDAVTDEELNFDQGDDFIILKFDDPEWFFARRVEPYEGEPLEGYIPKSFCQYDKELDAVVHKEVPEKSSEPTTPTTPTSPNSKQQHQSPSEVETLKKSMTKSTLSLAATYPSVPSGFRPATLTSYQMTCREGLLSTTLLPTFEKYGYRYRDMQMNVVEKKMKPVITQFNLAFTVAEARHVPIVGQGQAVYGRYINVALFDKSKVIGNVQTVQAHLDPKNDRVWKFSVKKSMFPSNNDHSFVVRTDEFGPDMCILFELVIVLARKLSDGSVETQHISCGWSTLPILGIDGKALESKTYSVRLFGGTPFEKDVPLEELIENIQRRTIWDTLRRSVRYPQLEVSVWKINSKLMDEINYLPPTCTVLVKSIKVLVLFRRLMYLKMVHDRETPSTKPTYSPHLAIGLRLCDEADILSSLCSTWETKWMTMKRSEKREEEIVQNRFFETIAAFWPLITTFNTPKFMNGHQGRLDDRAIVMSQYLSDGPFKTFGQNPSNISFAPFEIEEVAFSYLDN